MECLGYPAASRARDRWDTGCPTHPAQTIGGTGYVSGEGRFGVREDDAFHGAKIGPGNRGILYLADKGMEAVLRLHPLALSFVCALSLAFC